MRRKTENKPAFLRPVGQSLKVLWSPEPGNGFLTRRIFISTGLGNKFILRLHSQKRKTVAPPRPGNPKWRGVLLND